MIPASMASARGRPRERATQIPRLSRYDLHCLAVETPARPIHIGVLAMVEGQPLLDPAGRLRLVDLRNELAGRVSGLPELRRVVFRPGPLAGRPLWVDDRSFSIDRHVDAVELPPPGDETTLLALVEALLRPSLDRSRPLWHLWFLTGLADGRVGVLIVLHHALADGRAATRLLRALLEPPMAAAGTIPARAPTAEPPPPWAALLRDAIVETVRAALRLARPATWRRVGATVRALRLVNGVARRAAATSLNAPVGPRRRLAIMRLDLADARRIARAHGCGVNDVVLALVTGGVRALLDARGEPVATLRPRAGVAVALFGRRDGDGAGNDIGTLHVPLPVGEADPVARLPLIASERSAAGGGPLVALEPVLRATLGRIRAFRRSLEHQRLVNLAQTFVPGPPAPISILGARVLDLLPIAPLTGNVGLSFVAQSYAGHLTIAVRADADRFPDLDVLSAAMATDWRALAAPAAA